MNKLATTFIAAVFAAGASGNALARHGADHVDYARVVSATPIYETVEVNRPTRECWDERVVHRGHRSHTGTIAGGILGGVIGNQFGRGSGKTAMTVAGTLLGASIGRDVSRDNGSRGYVGYERRCDTVDHYVTEERLVGYRVKYRYGGETYVTRTDQHPGDRIPVEVSVNPLDHY